MATTATPTWALLAKIAQAQGRVTVQANCTADEAVNLMRTRAELTDRTIEQIADLVNAHQMWFTD
jgi:hypothetical protein